MKYCQSCGKILKKDTTAVDAGGRETCFCTSCYQEGHFTRDVSCSEMQEMVRKSLKLKPIPKMIKERIIGSIPDLERWRNEN